MARSTFRSTGSKEVSILRVFDSGALLLCSFFFVYSLLACDLSDHGEIMYSAFPVCCPRCGSPLQAPLLASAQACPQKM